MLGPDAFFDGAVVSFHFGHMFVAGDGVDEAPHVSQFASHRFKLVVGKDDGHFEASAGICA